LREVVSSDVASFIKLHKGSKHKQKWLSAAVRVCKPDRSPLTLDKAIAGCLLSAASCLAFNYALLGIHRTSLTLSCVCANLGLAV
jgi:hypothetical protein